MNILYANSTEWILIKAIENFKEKHKEKGIKSFKYTDSTHYSEDFRFQPLDQIIETYQFPYCQETVGRKTESGLDMYISFTICEGDITVYIFLDQMEFHKHVQKSVNFYKELNN